MNRKTHRVTRWVSVFAEMRWLLQFMVIIAVFLAFALQEGLASLAPEKLPEWITYLAGFNGVVFNLGLVILYWSLLRSVIMLLTARLNQSDDIEWRLMRMPGRIDMASRFLLIVIYGVQLTMGGWCRLIGPQWHLDRIPLVGELLLLLPFLLLLTIKLICFYPINRFVKEYVVAGQIYDGVSARPVWSLGRYLSFQLRQSVLIILAPLMLIFLIRDLVDMAAWHWSGQNAEVFNSERWSAVSQSVIVLGGLLVFVFSPFLLRLIWSTRSLPPGPLREQMQGFLGRIGLKCRDILLWDTYSSVANAAVMGVIRQARYVLLSDSIIENMPDSQIEAVCGHEAGHVHHHHIPLLVMFVGGTGGAGALAADQLLGGLQGLAERQGLDEWTVLVGLGVAALLMFGAWLWLFGHVSRRFEYQADVFSARSLRYDEQDSGELLNPRGAVIMSMALQRIAMLNGIAMNTHSWRHASIAARMEFLQDLSMKPGTLERFDRQMKTLKLAILILFVVMVIKTTWDYLMMITG